MLKSRIRDELGLAQHLGEREREQMRHLWQGRVMSRKGGKGWDAVKDCTKVLFDERAAKRGRRRSGRERDRKRKIERERKRKGEKESEGRERKRREREREGKKEEGRGKGSKKRQPRVRTICCPSQVLKLTARAFKGYEQ